MSDDRYGLVVRFEVLDGHEQDFDSLIEDALVGLRSSEPGTLAYVVHEVDGAPGVRVFYELYRDEEAFRAHESASHMRRFLTEGRRHLRSDPEVWKVRPVGGVVRPEADHGGA